MLSTIPSVEITRFSIVDYNSPEFVPCAQSKAELNEGGRSCTMFIENLIIVAEFKRAAVVSDERETAIFKQVDLCCNTREDGDIEICCTLVESDQSAAASTQRISGRHSGEDDHFAGADTLAISLVGQDSQRAVYRDLLPPPEPPPDYDPDPDYDVENDNVFSNFSQSGSEDDCVFYEAKDVVSPGCTMAFPLLEKKSIVEKSASPPPVIGNRKSLAETIHALQMTGLQNADPVHPDIDNERAWQDRLALQAETATLRTVVKLAMELDVLGPNHLNHDRRETMKSDLVEKIDAFSYQLSDVRHPWPVTVRDECIIAMDAVKKRLVDQLEDRKSPKGVSRSFSYQQMEPSRSTDTRSALFNVVEEGDRAAGMTHSLERIMRPETRRSLSATALPLLQNIELNQRFFKRDIKKLNNQLSVIRSIKERNRQFVQSHNPQSDRVGDMAFDQAVKTRDAISEFIEKWTMASPGEIALIDIPLHNFNVILADFSLDKDRLDAYIAEITQARASEITVMTQQSAPVESGGVLSGPPDLHDHRNRYVSSRPVITAGYVKHGIGLKPGWRKIDG